jgi:hypothetical protein
MKISTHNTEQAARGYLTYALAMRGYKSLLADSRFPAEDMLVVSPFGKHFGIEVKGQSTKNFWRFTYRAPNPEVFWAFVFVPQNGTPTICIMSSTDTMKLWKDYKEKAIAKGSKEENQWGLPWTTPLKFQDRWDLLPE